MRTLLNGTFYNNAFSDSEKERIIKSKIDNSVQQGSPNPYHQQDGNNTEDNVFLLSYKEAESYFPAADLYAPNPSRVAKPTAYVLARNEEALKDGVNSNWWLRSPGYQTATLAVGNDGRLYAILATSGYAGVRPAIWIML